MGPVWQALALEAGLAAEHLAAGVTTLGKANYAHKGLYFQAFFDLSIGFERTAKLAIIIDDYIANNKTFPTNKTLKNKYGHNIVALLEKTDQIAESRIHNGKSNRLPCTIIHKGIIKTLSEFADKSRYYNLDYLTSRNNVAAQSDDPLKVWYENVIVPILNRHYTKRQKDKHINNARIIDAMLSDFALVRFHAEDGHALDTAFDASLQTAQTKFAKSFSRMYVMQIMRFLSLLLSDLSYVTVEKGYEDIPYLNDFFGIFFNDDKYFKSRKTWSIYAR